MGAVAYIAHIELLTPKIEESLCFFRDILGLCEVARQGQSIYLRAWGEYDQYSLKLTEARQAGVGHTAFRVQSLHTLEDMATHLAASGQGVRWIDGDKGHGRAYQFRDLDGHRFEIYYESERYQAPPDQQAALKNQPQRLNNRGIGVRRLDHVNFFSLQPMANRLFLQEQVGAQLTEQLMGEDGMEIGSWLTFTNKAHDLVYTFDASGVAGRFHHLAYWVDSREDVLRAADLYLENSIFIEASPSKHAIAQGFFLYGYEPGGNRIEVTSGSYLIFAPDWQPIVWNHADRAKGQAWGNPTVASFQTYGTPHVS